MKLESYWWNIGKCQKYIKKFYETLYFYKFQFSKFKTQSLNRRDWYKLTSHIVSIELQSYNNWQMCVFLHAVAESSS